MSQPLLKRLAGIALLAACIGVGASTVRAQPGPGGDTPRQERPDRGDGRGEGRRGGPAIVAVRDLLGELNLSEDQTRQTRQILRETMQKNREKLQDAQNMEPREAAAVLRETLDELQTNLSAVLNDEQKATFNPRMSQLLQRLDNASNPPADAPTTAPAGGPGGGMRGGFAARIETALAAADLTDDQKAQLEPILAEVREKVQALLAEARDAGPDQRAAMRDKMRAISDEAREKIMEILTPEQREKVRQAMQNAGPRGRDGANGRDGGPRRDAPPPEPPLGMAPPTPPAADMSPPMTGDDNSNTNIEAGNTGLAASHDTPAADRPDAASLQVGDPMPAFSLAKLDGRVIDHQRFTGKPAVILFGSYTAPSFRDRMPRFEQLARRIGPTRANWLIVYTREMHPGDADSEPERNRDDKVHVPTHRTLAGRTAAARKARDELEITLDIAPDTMDDKVTRLFDGFPNAAFVFDGQGRLVARQQWADPFGIERALRKALKK